MIQNVLRDIGGIGIYGVISVCLFFLVFSMALVRACLLKKQFLKSMSALPLDDGVRPSPAAAALPHSHPEGTGTVRNHSSETCSCAGNGRVPAPTKGVSHHE
jgi:hypothetical protein